MPDLKIFIAQDIEFYHSHPFWYLDFGLGTKNFQLRLVADLTEKNLKLKNIAQIRKTPKLKWP